MPVPSTQEKKTEKGQKAEICIGNLTVEAMKKEQKKKIGMG